MEFQHKLTETYSTSLTSSLSLSLKRIWLQKKSFEQNLTLKCVHLSFMRVNNFIEFQNENIFGLGINLQLICA